MHQDNLKFLYSEYKNCMKNEFYDYLGRDDEYKSYLDKCYNQKQDIHKYFSAHFQRVFKISPDREEKEVLNKYQRRFNQFGAYGWTGNQIKNYFLNYDRSQEEYDVWVNRIMTRESHEKYGIKNEIDDLELMEERLPILLNGLITDKIRPSFYEAFKFTGKPIDEWKKYVYNGYVRDVNPMS